MSYKLHYEIYNHHGVCSRVASSLLNDTCICLCFLYLKHSALGSAHFQFQYAFLIFTAVWLNDLGKICHLNLKAHSRDSLTVGSMGPYAVFQVTRFHTYLLFLVHTISMFTLTIIVKRIALNAPGWCTHNGVEC